MAAFRYALVLLTAALLTAVTILGYVPPLVPLGFMVMGLLTGWVYARDKQAAESGTWRVPEKTLHLLELCGGWPGALYAQQALRHKTRKIDFQAVFWMMVVVNVSVLLWLHFSDGIRFSSAFYAMLGRFVQSAFDEGLLHQALLFLVNR